MIYIVLLILSALLTLFIKQYATKKAILDIPNQRSSHTTPVPHGGGVAIATTWFIGLVYLHITNDIPQNLFFALLCGGLISIVSLLDDIFNLSAKLRLFTHILVSLLGLYMLGGVSEINLYYFSITNFYITNTLAFLTMLWFINLYNFLDGIDGYASSQAIFLGLAGFILFNEDIFLVFIVSSLGFLFFNWEKAKIFMGDVGSTLLGYNVAIFTFYFKTQGFSLMVWLVLFAVFWFDATLTLIKRIKNKENITTAHKKHTYQKLVQMGWSHQKVVLSAMGINMILFCLIFVFNPMMAFFITMFMLYIIVKWVSSKT
jgi:Fuc2NAc and GlcNAc transferase